VSRVHRLRASDRIFFVTVNLRRQINPFTSAEYPLIIEALEGARQRLRFLLCGYVLMPDHWHALIWVGQPLTISQVIHHIKKVSARRLHERRGTAGPVWQHQFWDRFVRHAKEFRDRLVYMHLNPVRKNLVTKAEEWRWSSYNNFALARTVVTACPIQIDVVHLSEEYRG
jgi:REP element-mobilizing transposase RayT